MALNQKKYFVIPNQNDISDRIIKSKLEIIDNKVFMFEDDFFWERYDKASSDKIVDSISKEIKQNKSWSEDLLLFGDEDGSCIKILIENLKIVSFTFDIDYKSNFYFFIRRVFFLCKENDLLILDDDFNILNVP